MKVLFVNCVDERKSIQKSYYPLSFGYLVSYAQKQGLVFRHGYAEHVNLSLLESFKPDVVALTCITENYPLAERYARLIKMYNSKVKVIIGGVHISAVPYSLSEYMDVGIIGEGERTFYELAECNFEANPSIAGLVYKGTVTADRGLIEPLDSIPFPDRGIYADRFHQRPHYVFTSRGCCYRCKFCFSSRFWRKVRFHSPEYVADELRQVHYTFGANHVNIYDDLFIMDLERVKRIAELVKPLSMTYSIAARANMITDEVAQVLKDMGVTAVGMGLESNSQRILDFLEKGNTVEDNQNAVTILRKHGLNVHCSFIRDVPTETRKDLKLTFKFIKDNKLSYDLYTLMRFPRTPLDDGSTDWSKCQVKYNVPFSKRVRNCLVKAAHFGKRCIVKADSVARKEMKS